MLGIFFAAALFLPLVSSTATSYKTLTATFEKDPELGTMLYQGETATIGTILLESEGGKIEVERIALGLTGDADSKNIRRAFLHNQFGALVATGSVQTSSIIFPANNGIIVRDDSPVTLKIVLEMGVSADIGKTIGFRLLSTDSIFVRTQDYEVREIADTFPMSIAPLTIADPNAAAFVTAEFVEEPDYQKYFSIADQSAFATLELKAVGNDAVIEQLVIDIDGSLSDRFLKGVTLTDANGTIVAGPIDAIGRQLIFSTPISLPDNTKKSIGIVVDIPLDAGEGDDLFFEIDPRLGIVATSDGETIPIVANDVLRSMSKKIYSSSMAFWTSWLNPKPRVLKAGETGVTLLEYEAQSTTENTVVKRVELEIIGDSSALQNIRLIKKPGLLLGSQNSTETSKIVFENIDYTLEAGKIESFLVTADIVSEVQNGATVQVIVPRQEMLDGTPTYGGPATGSVFTLGEKDTTATLDIELLAPAKKVIGDTNAVPLAKLRLDADRGNVEVTGIDFVITGNTDFTRLSEFRLVDEYNRVVARASQAEAGNVAFANPFAVPTSSTMELLLVADIESTTATSFLVEITAPQNIIAFDLQNGKAVQSSGSFPLRTSYIDITSPPLEPYLKAEWEPTVGGDVPRASTDVELGAFVFSAYGKDVRVERIALTQAGTVGDKLGNVLLVSEDGQKITGRASNDIIVFDDDMRIPANTTKRYRFVTDFLITATAGSTFQMEIAGTDQIIAVALGNAIPVIANYPLKGSRFDVVAMTTTPCSLQVESVCGRKYELCDGLVCQPQWQTYDNQCLLEADGAVFAKAGVCSGTISTPTQDGSEAPKPTPDGFWDVPDDSPFATAIDYIRTAGIVQGFDDGSYQPDKSIARAGFIKIVVEAKYADTEITSCIDDNSAGSQNVFFPDVPASEWFAPYVCVAKVKGIIQGFPDGTFRPEKEVSFVEAAKIIANTFADSKLTDGDPWYQPYVAELQSGAAIPTSITRFDQLITRGEMAELIYRILEEVTDRESIEYEEFR